MSFVVEISIFSTSLMIRSLNLQQIFNPVVMAGGIGSRLWPISRASVPKQYQQLLHNDHDHTMVQQTFTRLSSLSLGKSLTYM